MQERSIANSVRGRFASALVLSLLFLASSWVTAVSDAELENGVKFNSSSDAQMNLYTMYIASQNSSAGGDGFITTQVPESGGQESWFWVRLILPPNWYFLEIDWPGYGNC